MQRFLQKITFLFLCSILGFIGHAQVVTKAWATLASGADPATAIPYPAAIAIDKMGNVFVASYSTDPFFGEMISNSGMVSKITPDGTVTQPWATLASTADPTSIAIDASGNVYTANYRNSTISKVTSAGAVTTIWAQLASNAHPQSIAIDASGNVYTANFNNTISKVTSAGAVTTIWAQLASNASPLSIAIDASGNVYTANNNNTISKVTSAGTLTQPWATLTYVTYPPLPQSIAIDASGNVYTANVNNNTISKVTSAGAVTTIWATLASDAFPKSIAIDASGNVYTANGNNTISKVTSAGELTQAWATLASDAGPTSIAIDASGNVYTANGNNTISKVASSSSNANLSSLTTTAGTLSPTFAATTANYTATVANSVSSITVTPTKADANATIQVRVNGGSYATVASGSASSALGLNVGGNTINVLVTAQDGTTTKTYTITVTKLAALDKVNLTSTTQTPGAYSLRKLSTSYTGNAIKVRRSSDNGLQDIGFTTNGDLDTAALKNFVGSDNGFVTIWYDQSGAGNNAVQATTNLQPAIATAGTVLRMNGRPALSFNSSKLVTGSVSFISSQPYALNIVHQFNTTSGNQMLVYSSTATLETNPTPVTYIMYAGASANVGSLDVNTNILSAIYNTTSSSFYKNGSLTNVPFNTGTLVPDYFSIGQRNDAVNAPLTGFMAEFICVGGSFAERANLETNQKNYYRSVNANLSTLTSTAGTLSPTFAATNYNYTATVANSVSSTTVTPTTADANATIQVRVNGGSYATVASGSASSALGLNVGSNTINVRVTAQDGTTAKTYTITVLRAATAPGNTLNFTGTEAVTVPSNASFGVNKVTIETWVYWTPSAATDIQFICSKGIGAGSELFEMHTGSVGANSLRILPNSNVYIDLANVLPVNKWTHIAYVHDPGTNLLKVYINGVDMPYQLTKGSISDPINTNSNSFSIGQRSSGEYRFTGNLDEFRFWNVVRTQTEIQANMLNAISPTTTGLVAYYNFDDGIGGGTNSSVTTLYDQTANANNGILSGFNLTGSTSNWVESYAMVLPTVKAASGITSTGFTANWTAPATGVVDNGYRLDVSTSSTFASLVSGYNGLTVSGTSQAITGLNRGTTYYYRVRADKTSVTGQGGYSATMLVTTLSSNANLSALILSSGTLSPTFDSATANYTTTVANSVSSITVTPTTADANATVKVNGTAVTNGNASGAINLNVGSNTISVVVTAQDGTTTKTYTITITRNINAPNISYAAGNKAYPVGTAIAALNPTNTGGAVASPGVVTTLAGSGTATFADGTGTTASFNSPISVAVDGSGTVYVADYYNNRIRKISPAGVVTTLAGSGTAGYADGIGTAANFNAPTGVAVDGSGTVYVTEYYNHRIRKISPAGVVTTLAGSGTAGYADGIGTAASFNAPRGVAVDGSGTVYVADYGNYRIRKITPQGVVTTLAGSGTATFADGTGTAASFKYPSTVAVDGSGTVYVADYSNHRIRKISPVGVVTTLAGSGTAGYADGTGTAASFNGSYGVAVDGSGTVYVADLNNHLIRKISATGVVTTLAGSTNGYADGTQMAASFSYPIGVAVDGIGTVYVADQGNNKIRKITQGGYSISPALPAGLSIDATTGVISGTPTAVTAATDYVVTATNAGGTSSYTINIAIAAPAITWTGTTSTNWAVTSNWSSGSLPTVADSVVVPAAPTNQPTIGNSTIASVKSVTVQSGASLTVAPSGALIVANTATGTVTLQQSFIGQRGWRVLANPFSTATNIATTATNNGITIGTTANTASGLTDSRTFSNSTNTWSNVTGTTWAANTPYALFVRGLAGEVTGSAYTGGPTAFTYNVSGTLNGNSVAITPASSTGNFLLVGNPYAAPVNSKALTGQTTNTPYYTYQIAVTGTPRVKAGSWLPVLSSGTTSTIPVLGVIAYQPANTSTFNVTTNDINTGGSLQTGLFGTETVIKNVELVVTDKAGIYQDKCYIRSDANATDKSTDNTDLIKFYNDNVNLYSITPDAQRVAIDARKELSNTIPLGISATAGTYSINVANNNVENATVYLHDKLNNRLTELKTGSSYSFDITTDAATKGENRFELQFLNKATTTTGDNSGGFTAKVLGNVISNSQAIKVQVQNANNAVIQVKDLSGKTITSQTAVNGINSINISKAALGMYVIQTTDGNHTVTEKVEKQ